MESIECSGRSTFVASEELSLEPSPSVVQPVTSDDGLKPLQIEGGKGGATGSGLPVWHFSAETGAWTDCRPPRHDILGGVGQGGREGPAGSGNGHRTTQICRPSSSPFWTNCQMDRSGPIAPGPTCTICCRLLVKECKTN